jgi:hypothetical protein
MEFWVALIAAGAALLGSLLGSWLTRTTEHKQWHRNEKAHLYGDFLKAMEHQRFYVFTRRVEVKGFSQTTQNMINQTALLQGLKLVASEPVSDAARAYMATLEELMKLVDAPDAEWLVAVNRAHEEVAELVDLMRRDLDLKSIKHSRKVKP